MTDRTSSTTPSVTHSETTKSQRGGRRPGAGRPRTGVQNPSKLMRIPLPLVDAVQSLLDGYREARRKERAQSTRKNQVN